MYNIIDKLTAVQVKNVSSDLTLSSLAATNTSKSGEGFFKRMCSIHKVDVEFNKITIVHFGPLGDELNQIKNGNPSAINTVISKLTSNHGLTEEEAAWLVSCLNFEKVTDKTLNENIMSQISSYVEVMAAPDLAKKMLIQYVSELSYQKGYTTLSQWQNQMHDIGVSISSIDGFYKEYNKSLVRLSELKTNKPSDALYKEFSIGSSSHPDFIRNNLDFLRDEWMDKIRDILHKGKTAVVKGVSGQGKTTLCYRYLLDNYPEEMVFCIKSLDTVQKAENLVNAISGIAKHLKSIIVYIDVSYMHLHWAYFLRELYERGINLNVIVSIRDEDYNMAMISGGDFTHEIVELCLTKEEANVMFCEYTKSMSNPPYNSFEDAWLAFGNSGPMIEFMYLLSHNETLTDRLQKQVKQFTAEKIEDTWLEILTTIALAGKTNCPLNVIDLKQHIECSNIRSAINRFKDEYLIKVSDDGNWIESLHPVRASILFDLLIKSIGGNIEEILLNSIMCISSEYSFYLLIDHLNEHGLNDSLLYKLSEIQYNSWFLYASVIKSLLWFDVKRFYQLNMSSISAAISAHGNSWFIFMPIDISGLERPDKIMAEYLYDIKNELFIENLKSPADGVKSSLALLHIDYKYSLQFLRKSLFPAIMPLTAAEWSGFGYSLFWKARIQKSVSCLPFELSADYINCFDECDLKSLSEAALGLYYNPGLSAIRQQLIEYIIERIMSEYSVLKLTVSDSEASCIFAPPMFQKNDHPPKNFNHYWVMRMVSLLQNLYPEQDYISAELVGSDIFSELGIQMYDSKKRIPKQNRFFSWIVEINSWFLTRVNFENRPDGWISYTHIIDDFIVNADNCVTDIICMIDEIYSHGKKARSYFTDLSAIISRLKKLDNTLLLLPKSVVDHLCLYREDMNNEDTKAIETSDALAQYLDKLAYKRYKSISSTYSKIKSSLRNFCFQFDTLLIDRIKNTNEDTKAHLANYNLFEYARLLSEFYTDYIR